MPLSNNDTRTMPAALEAPKRSPIQVLCPGPLLLSFSTLMDDKTNSKIVHHVFKNIFIRLKDLRLEV